MSPSLLRILTSARERDEAPITLKAYWGLYQKFLPRGTYGASTLGTRYR